MGRPTNRYTRIIEEVFRRNYREGARDVPFTREEVVATANDLGIPVPKNLGDVLYSFRYRAALPPSIQDKAPTGEGWIIRPVGRSRYSFVTSPIRTFVPNPDLAEIKIPDATPGIISLYSLTDEQALLAKIRYNRLIDIFTGVTCYSLQSHLRTQVPSVGQVETDEVYIGIDRRGSHYVFPVQAKGKTDTMNVVQIEQDFALCAAKYPSLIAFPIGAQFITETLIALFRFQMGDQGVVIEIERHYRLVPAADVSETDLQAYRQSLD